MSHAAARDEPSIIALLADEKDEPTLHYGRKYLEYALPLSLPASNISQINFDMRDKMRDHILYTNGCWEGDVDKLPQAGTTFSAAFPSITPKTSAISYLERVVVKSGNTPWLDEDQSIALAAHVRMMTERDQTWLKTHGSELMFSPDHGTRDTVGALATVQQLKYPNTMRYIAAPDDASNADSTYFDQGHLERTKACYDACLDANGVPRTLKFARTGVAADAYDFSEGYTERVRIRLRDIHDFFVQFKFPVVGHHMSFEFHFSTAGKTINPLLIGSVSVDAATPPNNVAVTAANTGVSIRINNTTGYSPRLWYERVEYGDSEYKQVVAQMAAGMTRKITYRTYNTQHNVPGMMNLVNGATPQLNVETNVVRPTRLIVLAMPAGLYPTPSWPAPATGPNGLTRVWVTLNGKNVYSQSIDTPQHHYELLRESMKMDDKDDNLSLLSYGDFLRIYRFHIYDLSRIAEQQTPDTEAPCSVSLSCQVASVGNVDLIVLTERLRTVSIFQSESRVESRVVDGTRI